MMKNRLVILLFALAVAACDPVAKPLPSELDDSYAPVSIEHQPGAVEVAWVFSAGYGTPPQ